MKKIFTTFNFRRIPKLEFPDLINGVIAITEKYKPETMFITGLFLKLKQVQPRLKSLAVVYTKTAETPVLKDLRNKLEALLKAILTQTKAVVKANLDSQAEQRLLVLPFIEKYFNNIITDSPKTRKERLTQMFETLDGNSELSDAVNAVGLSLYIEELRTLIQSMESTQSHRRKVKSERPRMKTKEIIIEVSTALVNYLKSVEIAMIEHPELDYMPLVNELNELFVSYKTDLKLRNALNKAATEEEKAKAQKTAEDAAKAKDKPSEAA
jgi:hypothetical protein